MWFWHTKNEVFYSLIQNNAQNKVKIWCRRFDIKC